jgi:ubiquinone/menaquinone biosynthesis C-methylase UbiE
MDIAKARVEGLYHKVAVEYNLTPLSVDQGWVYRPSKWGLIEMLAIARHMPPNGVFVDIGTGCGIAPRFAQALGAQVTTIDSYSASGASAMDNVKAVGIVGHFCDVERESLPIESGTADCVFFGDVIEHLQNSPKRVLCEIFRVLKPNGICISATPNATRLTVRLKVLMGLTNWPNIRDFFDEKMHAGHHHEYTIDEFKFAFEKTGFDVCDFVLFEENLRMVKISNMSQLATHDRSRKQVQSEPVFITIPKYFLLSLCRLFPRLRGNMLLVARKPAS